MAHSHHHHSHDHHQHGHSHDHNHSTQRNIFWAFILNLSFTFIELVGGYLTGSLAILADAVHDLGDSLSLGLAWYFEKVAAKKSDSRFSYGYGRFSLLSALITGTVILTGSLFILIESYSRIQQPSEPHGPGMFALACLGVVINGYAAFKILRNSNNQNEKTLRWHLIEDFAGWIVVLVGSIGIWAFQWNFLDPILAAGLAIFVSYNVFLNLRQTVSIFLQHAPPGLNMDDLRGKISTIQGIQSIHDLHVWSIDGAKNILSVHIKTIDANPQEAARIKDAVREELARMGQFHVTIEIETQNETCKDDCEVH